MVSHLVSFGFGGLAPRTDTWSTHSLVALNQTVASLRRGRCEISHVPAGRESPRSGGAQSHSLRGLGFLKKNKIDILQGVLGTKVSFPPAWY